MSDVSLRVGGLRYTGWTSARVRRSVEAVAASFELSVTDRITGQLWPIRDQDEVEIEVDGDLLVRGIVDRRTVSLTAQERTTEVAGREWVSILVDCSVPISLLHARNETVLQSCSRIAGHFGVQVTAGSGIDVSEVQRRVSAQPGETAYAMIDRLAASVGAVVLATDSGIELARVGQDRADALVEGQNILAARAEFDSSQRFRTYVVTSQIAGSDGSYGASVRTRGTATDDGVTQLSRGKVIVPSAGLTRKSATARAQWEARIAAARAARVAITVVGWRQTSGPVWSPGALTRVSCPSIGVDGDLVISDVELAISSGGELAILTCVRPDAYVPEPRATVVRSSGAGGGEIWRQVLEGG